jgi:hypothetical protein
LRRQNEIPRFVILGLNFRHSALILASPKR